MTRLPVSSLVSPPEAEPLDSFNAPCYQPPFPSSNKLPPIAPERAQSQTDMDLPSPPVTPYERSRKINSAQQPDANAVAGPSRDPVLFPSDRRSSAFENEPLFGPELAPPAAQALVEKHIAKRKSTGRVKFQPPTRDEYMLALACASRVITNYNRNPGAWAKKERQIFDRQWDTLHPKTHESNSKFKKLAPAPGRKGQSSGGRVSKPQRAKRTPRSTPKSKALDSFESTPARSAPKPRVIGTNRDDTDYNSLPDYSPPLATLRGTKGLKADWKGQVLDLSNDPDRNALDSSEISLAATLRLSCATYLCSKRRIFEARLHALRRGKEFRKTDAQQACKIDVNKASKLWTAYDRVGWFNADYFKQYN
ncbi:conserved hypothetical protein [Uncinocarpus reesii 1704]|uniref:SWIRM domain-containing protein n=1 Tax=Uncinocarpus reesii (strain UAMH 1704) TaxID=336963 RepID=C4JPK1_UNCRE|nr:uncharacterized protein UREG_03173 [Uncinocarpus reesii 1704]EEP78327.1 conserved hypothetical protein [Uncinocarpus reesii 1704]